MPQKVDSKQMMTPELRLKLLEDIARKCVGVVFQPGFASVFSSLSPQYPIAFMYQQGGLYYYSSSCCIPSPFHNGMVVSDTEITDLGCGKLVIQAPELNEGITSISTDVTGSVTRTGYSFGVSIEGETPVALPLPVDVLIADPEPGYLVSEFGEFGTNPVSLNVRGNPIFGKTTAHVLYLVTFVESSNRIVTAHAVSVPDLTGLSILELTRFQLSSDLPVVLPDLGAVEDPDNPGESLDLLITNYA